MFPIQAEGQCCPRSLHRLGHQRPFKVLARRYRITNNRSSDKIAAPNNGLLTYLPTRGRVVKSCLKNLATLADGFLPFLIYDLNVFHSAPVSYAIMPRQPRHDHQPNSLRAPVDISYGSRISTACCRMQAVCQTCRQYCI